MRTIYRLQRRSHQPCVRRVLSSSTATDWVVANAELTAANRLCIKELTTGDRLNVRVVAVNAGGPSEACVLAESVPIREVVGEFASQ